MIINHNISAINANRVLKNNDLSLSKSLEKVASGLKINRAGDDASGLAVSEKMRSQIRGLYQANRNTESGISFIQVAEGYLQETQDMIHRLRELAVQASHGVYSDEDRLYIQVEVSQLVDEVDRVASHAQFNGMNILTGRFARETGMNVTTGSMWFHIGANMDQRERVYIGTMTAKALGFKDIATEQIITISTADKANMTIGIVDNALKFINKQRADLGAYQNRLEHTINNLTTEDENMTSAESNIRDVDMAEEMMEYTKQNILVQSATSMLTQANSLPESVLSLLQ